MKWLDRDMGYKKFKTACQGGPSETGLANSVAAIIFISMGRTESGVKGGI
jgi:hypothetical protein